MSMLSCLWTRPRLERYADRELGPRLTRSVAAHVSRCATCSGRVERQRELRRLVKAAIPDVPDPDWAAFWPAVHTRIVRERTRPIKDPWWIPLWSPVWGHPRLALGGVMAAGLALTLALWPVADKPSALAWAGPVVVQDVSTPDPNQSVMVYSTPESTPDQALTVIWLFNSAPGSDES